MKTFGISLVSALALASSAIAQRVTTTYTWEAGDTVVYTVSTDPLLGIVTTQTLTTLTAPANGVLTTPLTTTPLLTTPLATLTTPTTTARTTARTTTRTTRTTATTTAVDDAGRPLTTTGPRVVGQQETMDPMRTTTYWYDPGNGVWTVATWTASVTAEPELATYIPTAGTIVDYNQYQSEVNGNLFASAKGATAAAAGASGARATGAAGKRAVAGAVGVVGAVVGAVAVGL